jgi:excisionase family DNA binding protein
VNVTPEPWVTLEETAQHLGVSTDTVHRWIRAKGIPVHRMGRQWRFKVSEVDAWVRAGKAAGEPPPGPPQKGVAG